LKVDIDNTFPLAQAPPALLRPEKVAERSSLRGLGLKARAKHLVAYVSEMEWRN
jgi:hypothetical protein